MTNDEKRELLVSRALTRKNKNQYTQDINKRTMIEAGFGDCSGTVWYWYYKLFGIHIGANTEAQIKSNIAKDVKLDIVAGVPDESKMKKGDLLYFRGSDNSRTKGVGHVEMYIGNGQIFGHGSGVGGTVKNMASYCKKRFNTKSTEKLKNKGLICVRRIIGGDDLQELIEVNDIVWEFAHRGIITDKELWLKKLEEDKDSYWLARKTLHALRCEEEK